MNISEVILKNKKYKAQIEQLDDETLRIVAKDHIKALEEASKGIKQEEPEKENDVEYLQAVADAMQKLAQRVLDDTLKK